MDSDAPPQDTLSPTASAGPNLADVFALAPDAQRWARDTRASAADLALALDLGARLLRAAPPGVWPAPATATSRGANSSSALRGAAGEDEVFRALAQAHQVRDVSRRAHSGDFVCDTPAGPVSVEVKHYSGTVPAAEVQKFLRDLRENGAAAGAFLSLSSPIAGQREAIAVALEPRVAAGTLVPVVFAAPPRAAGSDDAPARLSRDVAVAAVDVAVCLAAAYPRGVRGLHGRDSALAYAAAAEQLADGVCSIRTDLARLAGGLAADAADLGDRLAALGRETRHLARSQRADAEDVVEASTAPGQPVAVFRERFEIRAPETVFHRVVAAVEALAVAGGPPRNRWRFLKARAIHVPTDCGFSFLKGATVLRIPAGRLSAAAIVSTLTAHPKKISVADGEVSIEIDPATLATALFLLDAVAPAPKPGGSQNPSSSSNSS